MGGVALASVGLGSGGAVAVERSWVHQRREREEAAEAALAATQCAGWVGLLRNLPLSGAGG